MKCVICHGDNIREKKVYEEFDLGNDVVRLPIEIPVCANCGERYYDRKTMRILETIREQIREERLELTEIGKVLLCQPG